MSREIAKKEPKAKNQKNLRKKGMSRAKIVLSIVATDNTFNLMYVHPDPLTINVPWRGKCIHCNASVLVHCDGATSATIEHIDPQCNGGDKYDARNLALACARCNNEKGIRHDKHAGEGGRADEVIAALKFKRETRWRS